MTGARGPGDMDEHLTSLAGNSSLPGIRDLKPALNQGPGCLCTAHHPTTPPFTFLKERGHWSDLVICGKNSGWGGSIKRKHCTAQMGNTTKAMW